MAKSKRSLTYRQQYKGSYITIARCNVAGRGENGHWQTLVLVVAGVALVAENVDDAQTLVALVKSNTEK